MSDGGAGPMVKCGELLSHSRVGRVVLALLTMYLLCMAAAAEIDGNRHPQQVGYTLLIAAVFFFSFFFGTINAWHRNSRERPKKRAVGLFMMMSVLTLLTMFCLFKATAEIKGSRDHTLYLLAPAVIFFLFAIGTIGAWLRIRAERAKRRSVGLFMMIVGAIMLFGIMVVAGIIVLIRWRRRGDEEQLEKLDPAEIDRMALEEADGAI